MGNQIIYFASRRLNTTMETNDWRRIFVDLYYTSTLMVLDVYQNSNGRNVYQADYGNYGDTTKIVPTVTPPFIQFAQPPHTYV
jgi:hypothetical protein